jgi:uncharacterized membrane protein
MEAVILLIVLIVLLLVYSRMGDVKRLADQQATDLALLRNELSALRKQFMAPSAPKVAQEVTAMVPEPLALVQPIPNVVVEPPKPVEVLTEVPKPQLVVPPVPRPVAPPVLQPVYDEPQPSFMERFLRDNPDLEKFVGENLINKIGIAILVLGIGYFVKYAIDQEWLGEVGRVVVGLTAGGILLGLAHRLRQSFAGFSSVLVGGGLTVLYFTIAIAFHYYGLFSQGVAFAIMVVITGFGVMLTLAYNRVELAIMALIGGFATPFMVSKGAGNYTVLFTYILILDVGMLVLSYFKKWTPVHLLAYLFTVLLYGSWLIDQLQNNPTPPYAGALLFASLFYAVFYTMTLLYNLKVRATFSPADISLLLSNTAFYYGAGMTTLAHIDGGRWQGLFTVGLAGLNYGVVHFLYRRPGTDRTLVFLLIGLVVTFASLAVPVQLDGHYITMFWALEAVLLLWLARKSGLRLMATSSVVVTVLMLISLFMDWGKFYATPPEPPLTLILNKAFITSLVSIAGLFATRQLLARQETPFTLWLVEIPVALYRKILTVVTLAIIYLAGVLETDYQAVIHYGFGPNRLIVDGAYTLLIAVVLLVLAYRQHERGDTGALLPTAVLASVALLVYVLVFAPATLQLLENHTSGSDDSLAGFWWHYVSLASVVGLLVWLQWSVGKLDVLPTTVLHYWPWVLGILVVYTASWELFNHAAYFHFSGPTTNLTVRQLTRHEEQFGQLLRQVNKVGLPILWGLCAFVFMYLGLSRKNRAYRILSLTLFALTLLKLFLYDIRGISEGGRIAAFIILGVLLLVISFMYQRIKRLLLADTNPETAS